MNASQRQSINELKETKHTGLNPVWTQVKRGGRMLLWAEYKRNGVALVTRYRVNGLGNVRIG